MTLDEHIRVNAVLPDWLGEQESDFEPRLHRRCGCMT